MLVKVKRWAEPCVYATGHCPIEASGLHCMCRRPSIPCAFRGEAVMAAQAFEQPTHITWSVEVVPRVASPETEHRLLV